MTDQQPYSTEELDEIQMRVDSASPGPWISFVEGRDHISGDNFIRIGGFHDEYPDMYVTYFDLETQKRRDFPVADRDFIAHSRQDIPRLLAEIRRLREGGNRSGTSTDTATTRHISSENEAKIQENFSSESWEKVREILEFFDDNRVASALLTLSAGEINRLMLFSEVARKDFRDVLFWAENPPTDDEPTSYEELRRRLGLPPDPEGTGH